MKRFNIKASIEEAKEIVRKELGNLGLEVNLDNLKYSLEFGSTKAYYDENMPIASAMFPLFEETSADVAEKCFIDIVNEDGYTARAVISDKNIAKASKVIANAILMSYAGMVE